MITDLRGNPEDQNILSYLLSKRKSVDGYIVFDRKRNRFLLHATMFNEAYDAIENIVGEWSLETNELWEDYIISKIENNKITKVNFVE